jgi:TRAP-type C4-dicarboxylate transport system permease small subunit
VNAASGPHGWSRWLLRGPEILAAFMLLALVIVTCVDVIGRELHGLYLTPPFSWIIGPEPLFSPLKGGDELTVVFMAISVYAVFASITWREDHVCVDLIDMVWPKRYVGARQIVLNLIAAAFLAVVTWRLAFLAGRLAGDGEVTEYLRIPRGALTYFFAAMSGIATLCLLANCVRYLRGDGPLDTLDSTLEVGKHRID